MSELVQRSSVRAVVLAAVFLLLAACTSGNPEQGTTTEAPPPSSSADASSGADDADAVTIEVTLEGGKVTPNGEKINVAKGQKVIIKAISDHDDEIHVHGEYDVALPVKADEPATTSFVADKVGSFEMESHEPAKVLAILNVR